jgi:heme exporter protein B
MKPAARPDGEAPATSRVAERGGGEADDAPEVGHGATWIESARLIAGRDLLIEWRSRVALNQVLPFAAVVMIMFGFAIDDTSLMRRISPGLIVLATTFSLLLLVQRSFTVEREDGALDALRVAGLRPSALFWGKAAALAVQLAALQAVLFGLAVLLYDTEIQPAGVPLLVFTWVTATVALATVGTLYGGLAAGARGRETLLPLLLLPVVAPVLIGATRAVEAALGVKEAVTDGWPWTGLVAVFAAVFGAGGTLAFGPLIEDES